MANYVGELSLRDVQDMERSRLIETLISLDRFCLTQLSPTALQGQSTPRLRQLLMRVRRHYQARGY